MVAPTKAVRVTCIGETSTGEYTGPKTVGDIVMTLTGCELAAPAAKCASAGAAAGEIVTKQLEGILGVVKLGTSSASNKLGLALYPTGKVGSVTEFTCAGTTVSIQGSVIVPVMANKVSLTQALDFKGSKGKQTPESFLLEPRDVLEESINTAPFQQAGLTVAMTQTSEEPVEANSVV